MANFDLPFGVRIAGNDPIDKDRYVAATIIQRDAIVTNGRAYDGLQVYVEADKVLYILKGLTNADWEPAGGATSLKKEVFTLSNSQANVTVSTNVIEDDDQWSVIYNGMQWFNTDDFPGGNITINFATGVITLNRPVYAGDLLMVKYN